MERKEKEIFRKYFPENSIDYCFQLWETHRIQFSISQPRKSIYGNYFFKNGTHHISVNGNLNPEAFLVTFLHEVAHLLVRVHNQKRTLPHGTEWKNEFRNVLMPMLKSEVFSKEVANALILHLDSPRASSCSDPILHGVLMKNQPDGHELDHVSNLVSGSYFDFDGRLFQRMNRVRTRFDCIEIPSGKTYRFSESALVKPISNPGKVEILPKKGPLLETLQVGAQIRFRGETFQIVEHRRTRSLCKEITSGRFYLLNKKMEISN